VDTCGEGDESGKCGVHASRRGERVIGMSEANLFGISSHLST